MEVISIEIKASCKNTEIIRNILKFKKAEFLGKDHQIDTYFKVNSGRLKFREGNIENNLIYYTRENIKGPKQSNVSLYKTDKKSSLKEILKKSIGILIEVDKQREIYFIGNIKFHIDEVKNLGSFIEIEALDKTGEIGKDKLLKQCKEYLALFKIKNKDLINNSYSDLLLNKK